MLSDQKIREAINPVFMGLNAPYGAPRFLTPGRAAVLRGCRGVLMHLMALHAF